MTEANRIVASLLEYEPDLDIEATVQRWKPEVRLLSTTVNARTGGRVEGFDVMLYGDKDPVYVGTIAPRGKNVWHTVHIMGNVTPLEMRQAAATWARTPDEAAQMLIDATKRSWEPVMRYQKAWAGLAESEGTVVFDELPRQLKVEIGEYLFDNNPTLKDHWSWEYVVQELDELVDPVVLRVLRRPVQSVEDLDLTPLLKTDFKRLESEGFDPNFPVQSAFDAEDIVRDKLGESTDPKAVIDKEAEKAEAPKSEEHAEAGNYKKGHVTVQGLQISIENAKGSTRSGEDKNGKPWKVTLPAHYGYIAQVGGETAPRGKDKDHIDVYIGPNPGGMMVYVVNQNDEKGTFDEHKCMLGFESKEEAIKTYDAAFSGDLGPKLRGEVVSVTMKEFKEWLKSGKTKKPFERLAESLVSKLIENVDDFDPKDEIMRVTDLEQVATTLGYTPCQSGFYKDVKFGGRVVTLLLEQYDMYADKAHGTVDRLVNLSGWENFHRPGDGSKGWFGSAMYDVMVLYEVLPKIELAMMETRFLRDGPDFDFREILHKVGRYVPYS